MMERFEFLEQELWLLPEKALFWAAEKTAVIADLHLGKAATFRAHGIALPGGTTGTDLGRVTAVLEQTKAERLLILGDLLHAKAGRSERLHEAVAAWRRDHASLAIDLVLGNHDAHAGRPPESWGMTCVDVLRERPFVWLHEPRPSGEDGYVVAGHVHAGVSLHGGGERLTLPAFYFGKQYGLLPAFGSFTGFGLVQPKRHEPVFVVAEGEVIRVDP